jgi:hypothetical protein
VELRRWKQQIGGPTDSVFAQTLGINVEEEDEGIDEPPAFNSH